MGISANQARFLSLTARQVDMEQRIQQICQRRLRLSSELENVATQYNNQISNRKMSLASQTNQGIQTFSVANLAAIGYKVINAVTKTEAARSMNPISQLSDTAATSAGYTVIKTAADLVNQLTTNPSGKYILGADIDLSQVSSSFNTSVINTTFGGIFNGNGYTISNMNINTGGVATNNIGFFSQLSNTAQISNVAIENSTINAGKSSSVGLLAGNNTGGTIDNCYSTGSVSGGTDDATGVYAATGGLVGSNSGTISNSFSQAIVSGDGAVGGFTGVNTGSISNSFAEGDVSATYHFSGGFSGCNYGNGTISQSYASGNVTCPLSAGGFIGDLNAAGQTSHITDCYATGDVVGDFAVGGFIGGAINNNIVTGCYTSGDVTASGSSGGFLGLDQGAQNYGASNYYQNNMTTDNSGATSSIPASGWNANWDISTTPPTLKNTVLQGSIPSEKLEEGLRNGVYSLAREADEFSQETFDLEGKDYEEVDWRTTPEIYDELNRGDDIDAENKYDKTIAEINAQDKKLQLEQTSVEVEYKAVSSEKEAVKKILDTNAQSSFKYFS